MFDVFWPQNLLKCLSNWIIFVSVMSNVNRNRNTFTHMLSSNGTGQTVTNKFKINK